jgi:hypothetical protein
MVEQSLEVMTAQHIIAQIENDVEEAKDALLSAKIMQAFFVNKTRGNEDTYLMGDRVMLAILNHQQEFKAGDKSRVANLFPCYDGPFTVTKAFPEMSSYTLHLPNSLNMFPTYHASLLRCHIKNDAELFPLREMEWPGPVVTKNGLE